jgi:hypothetical protein
MRVKREWERVRSPHARFLEGLEAAVAAHPSASSRRGGVNAVDSTHKARLTLVGSTADNVIQMPTARKPRPRGDGGSPAA